MKTFLLFSTERAVFDAGVNLKKEYRIASLSNCNRPVAYTL